MTINYLTIAGVAKRLGLSPHTIATYVRDGRMPEPDATFGDGDRPKLGWLPETIDQWQAARPGKGGRPPKLR